MGNVLQEESGLFQKKSDSAISSGNLIPRRSLLSKAKKFVAPKPKPTKKKTLFKADRGDGTDFESGVPDEQHLKTTGADEGTEEDENEENDFEDKSDDGDNDDDGNDGNDDDDANDDDNQEGDDTNDDDKETDITKELYEDVNVNLGNEDTEMTNDDQGASEQQNKADEPVQSSSVSSEFTSKLLNLENPSPANNEIASLMETSARHATTVPENASGFTTTIPPPPQFNDRVTNMEKDMSEIKQVDQYAQALSSIPAIVDSYMDNKLGEAINKVILAHNLDCKQEAQDEKNSYIELVDT
ncbi:hypothetical protein Tco_0671189, partial [Tanacetum coccineum]